MGSKAGPSSPKKKVSEAIVSDEAMSDVGSDVERESVDSNAIDDQEISTPRPAERTSKPGRKSASLA